MSNLRPFQVVLLGGFFFFALISVVFIAIYQGGGGRDGNPYGSSVEVWGTFDRSVLERLFLEVAKDDKNFNVVTYREISEQNFDEELLNAIAEGRSPDLLLIPSEKLVKHRNKLIPFSYEDRSRDEIRSMYIDGAEIFALSDGLYALPLAVDPMVLYWNRDLFSSNSLAEPPRTWEYFKLTVVPRLTIRDNNRNILQSAVPLGEFSNVSHAKEILIMLAMQAGSPMVVTNGDEYSIQINRKASETSSPPFESALSFFTTFSNPNDPLYTWNRAQSNDLNAFLAGDVAMYFGFGSEAGNIQNRNPNLNFDMAAVPQGELATSFRTYGTFYGAAVPRATDNYQGATAVAATLTARAQVEQFTNSFALAPTLRSSISAGSDRQYGSVKYNAALIARSWLDPDPEATGAILRGAVEDVAAGRLRVTDAVRNAANRLTQEF